MAKVRSLRSGEASRKVGGADRRAAAPGAADSRTQPEGALPPWLRATERGSSVRVHVQPGARRSGIVGTHGDRLKIALRAPPVEGQANRELVEFIAERLALRRADVVVASGASSRDKTLDVAAPPAMVATALAHE